MLPRCGSPPRAWGRLTPPLSSRTVARFTPTCVGKTLTASRSISTIHGSPPRAWGRRYRSPSPGLAPRFTPTCVGKTRLSRACCSDLPVHPHVRGEDGCSASRWPWGNGSPPRAWGRPLGQLHINRASRFTPTCVGKTARSWAISDTASVHPHVRGEDSSSHACCSGVTGSPPRAWGRLDNDALSRLGHRFTPTCVGKTTCPSPSFAADTVHPHVRGEDGSPGGKYSTHIGSPPRAWGRRLNQTVLAGRFRFTPTCVGKTSWQRVLSGTCAVHPHVRGEDRRLRRSSASGIGSPPRAWGRRWGPLLAPRGNRFTPTCVGKTLISQRQQRPSSVHPHVRGEDADDPVRQVPRGRFTPTCVGKTEQPS